MLNDLKASSVLLLNGLNVKMQFISILSWTNAHCSLKCALFSQASTHKAFIFFCPSEAFFPCTLCKQKISIYLLCRFVSGKLNDYFKGLPSLFCKEWGKNNQNDYDIWYLNVCKVTWLPDPKWHITPKHYSVQTNQNLLNLPVVIGYWNVMRLENWFPPACQF